MQMQNFNTKTSHVTKIVIWGSLFTKSRQRDGHWYCANHVSCDHWHHSQSLTEFANSSRFGTSLPVQGSQFAKYPHTDETTTRICLYSAEPTYQSQHQQIRAGPTKCS